MDIPKNVIIGIEVDEIGAYSVVRYSFMGYSFWQLC